MQSLDGYLWSYLCCISLFFFLSPFLFLFLLSHSPPFSSFSSLFFTSPTMNVCSTVYDKSHKVYLTKKTFCIILLWIRVSKGQDSDNNKEMSENIWEVHENFLEWKEQQKRWSFSGNFWIVEAKKVKIQEGSIMDKCCNDLAECLTSINYNLLILNM